MRTRYTIALSMLAGLAVGAIAIQGLHAQAPGPIYMITITEISGASNAHAYATEYLPSAQASIKAHGGVEVAAGAGIALEGTLPQGAVSIVRWNSLEAQNAWKNSPENVAARQIGIKYAKINIIAVAGKEQ